VVSESAGRSVNELLNEAECPLLSHRLKLVLVNRIHPGADIPAAIVVFLVALPLCIGIAIASDAAPFAGIIAGVVGGVVVGLLSGSSLSVSGPAAGLAAIVAAAIHDLGSYQTFLLAAFLAGALQLVFGYFKGGGIGRYVPNAVIKGMLAAIGILIILKQIPHFVGYDADPEGEESFIQPDGQNTFSELWIALSRISPLATLIATVAAAILLFYETSFMKRQAWVKYLPGPLVAVISGVLLNVYLVPDGHALALSDEHVVQIPMFQSFGELAGFISMPEWSAIGNYKVWITAVTLAIVASLETLLSLEAADKLDPEKRISPANRELYAQGSGNMLSALIGGLPVTSVVVRTSANINAGAKSKASAVLHGLLLLTCVFTIPGILNMIPKAALASILILTGYKLANVALFKEYYSRGNQQFIPFIVTIVAIIFTDLLIGILVGILVGLYFVMRSNFRSAMIMVEDNGKYLIRFAREVSFLNKAKLVDYLQRIPDNSAVLIDPLRNEFMDRDIIETVNDFIASSESRGIRVYIMRDKRREEVFNDPYRLEMK
jgi:MFS superfamily sulfate permease-like transporter